MFTFAPPFASIVGRKLKNIHEQDLRTKGMIACFGLFAEIERNPISDRTKLTEQTPGTWGTRVS